MMSMNAGPSVLLVGPAGIADFVLLFAPRVLFPEKTGEMVTSKWSWILRDALVADFAPEHVPVVSGTLWKTIPLSDPVSMS